MIGIVNYGAGNIFSLKAALDRLNLPYRLVNNAPEAEHCDRLIIPGVGHAGMAMQKLQESGLATVILQTKKPVLGICVGMQLLTAYSEEGTAAMLSIAPMHTKLFNHGQLKVPHMGWNSVTVLNDNVLFRNISPLQQFYFVHSYCVDFDAAYSIAVTDYGIKFSAALQKDNFYGVQFHPEKSGNAGAQILVNFNEL